MRIHPTLRCTEPECSDYPLVWTEAWQGWCCVVCTKRELDQFEEVHSHALWCAACCFIHDDRVGCVEAAQQKQTPTGTVTGIPMAEFNKK